MSTTTLRVRTHECDSLGHVNNAVYIQYLQQATRDALDATLTARKLAIEYHAPAKDRDELEIDLSISNTDGERVVCEYEITRESDRATVVRAQIDWHAASPVILFPSPAADKARMSAPLKPFVLASDNGAKPFRWTNTNHQCRCARLCKIPNSS